MSSSYPPRPPQNFDQNFDDYAAQVDTDHSEMPLEPTGRTVQSGSSEQFQQEWQVRDTFATPEHYEDQVAPIQRRPPGGAITERLSGSLNGVYVFAHSWALGALIFTVCYLGQAAAPPTVARLLALIVNPKILGPMYLAVFLVLARKRIPGWVQGISSAIQEMAGEAMILVRLSAVLVSYLFVSRILG